MNKDIFLPLGVFLFIIVLAFIAGPFTFKIRKIIEYVRIIRYFSFIKYKGKEVKNKEVLLSLLNKERLAISRRIGIIKCKLLNIANSDNMTLWYLTAQIEESCIEVKKLEDDDVKIICLGLSFFINLWYFLTAQKGFLLWKLETLPLLPMLTMEKQHLLTRF